ncbi:hypothetical protein MMH89_03325 [Candidatus Comchoanobacter bicostacola]|uniref:RimM N-terminal domain-containing protein n=1 Tax=Candidatus Comchoanobacter bicostacola TaxID=2919598 RepID=A0ABY5DIR0_9GAMM|nr:hypothetical protein [Candidatus Comchoanobacter bicostacola]UTC24254.1 hypothetical protein MMH89_03325 [Candidatus Comchoanobacter bicostacola]
MQSQNNTSDLVHIGHLGTAHGIKGGLSIFSYTTPAELISQLEIQTNSRQIQIIKFEQHTKKNVVYIQGVSSRCDAEQLNNTNIYTNKTDFFEHYPEQILNDFCAQYILKDCNGRPIGTIEYIEELENILMASVQHDELNRKLCVSPQYIHEINHKQQFIQINYSPE